MKLPCLGVPFFKMKKLRLTEISGLIKNILLMSSRVRTGIQSCLTQKTKPDLKQPVYLDVHEIPTHAWCACTHIHIDIVFGHLHIFF